MLWVNWLPEILLVSVLLSLLLFLGIRRVGSIWMLVSAGLAALAALVYFWMRADGLSNTSPYAVFVLDSTAYFGRSISLVWALVGSIFVSVYQQISLKNKFKLYTLLIFFLCFLNTLFLAKPIMMFLISWLGCFIALNFMMTIESEQSGLRSALIRQNAVLMMIVCIFSALLNFLGESNELVLLLGCMISLIFPLNIIQIRNFSIIAPLAQAWWLLWTYFAGGLFWIRFGLPMFSNHLEVLGFIFSSTALLSSIISLCTQSSTIWLGATLSAVINLAWLVLILDPEQGTPLFYSYGALFLFVFTFSGYAFHQKAPQLKKAKIVVSLVLIAFFFPLIEELIIRGFLIFAVAAILVWFLLSISVIQQLGILITMKKSQEVDTILSSVLLVVFVISVIALTILKLPLLQLLNHHSAV